MPRTVEPETYRIELEPDVASATFSGTLSLDAIVREAVRWGGRMTAFLGGIGLVLYALSSWL